MKLFTYTSMYYLQINGKQKKNRKIIYNGKMVIPFS